MAGVWHALDACACVAGPRNALAAKKGSWHARRHVQPAPTFQTVTDACTHGRHGHASRRGARAAETTTYATGGVCKQTQKAGCDAGARVAACDAIDKDTQSVRSCERAATPSTLLSGTGGNLAPSSRAEAGLRGRPARAAPKRRKQRLRRSFESSVAAAARVTRSARTPRTQVLLQYALRTERQQPQPMFAWPPNPLLQPAGSTQTPTPHTRQCKACAQTGTAHAA